MRTLLLLASCTLAALQGCAAAPRDSGYSQHEDTRNALLKAHRDAASDCKTIGGRPNTGNSPSAGLFNIAEPVEWGEVIVPASGGEPERRALYARIPASGDLCVTLIAGGFGKPDDADQCLRGITPPVAQGDCQPGLKLESGFNGVSKQHIVRINGGFLVLTVKASTSLTTQSRLLPWPLIIRTPGLPGGAFAGKAVFAAVPEAGSGKMLRDCIYRPNQSGCACDGWIKPDNDDAKSIVYVDDAIVRPPVLHTLTKISCVEAFAAGATERDTLETAESAFLVNACKFATSVQDSVDNGNTPEWNPARWKCAPATFDLSHPAAR